MGSIMGSFFGAAFIVMLPIFPQSVRCRRSARCSGLDISAPPWCAHAELMIFGALIVWFLIVEPHGLARLWSVGKEKMRLWPFPH